MALFRMGLMGDLIVPGMTDAERTSRIKEKADRVYRIPGTRRTRVAASTLRDWLRHYERGGFEALKPPYRCDMGKARSISDDLVDRIVALREEDPSRSVRTIQRMLVLSGNITCAGEMPPSTVYRLLERRGLSRRAPPAGKATDRRAFAFERPNQLWQSDVMHGPRILDAASGRRRKTYLITLLDDATRVIPHAAFCWSEKLLDFLPVLHHALLRRGLSDRLFVDNGAAFASTHLSVICASLRIALLHARPYAPESKGKIERWHRTLREQFLSQIDLDQIRGLDDINRRLWAYVEGEYHRTPHRGLGVEAGGHATPLDRWMLHAESLRPAPNNLDEYFLVPAERLVYADRTVRLCGVVFEAPAEYVGRRVEVRYDPAEESPTKAFLYVRGSRVSELRLLDVHANTCVRRDRPEDIPAPQSQKKTSGLNYVELLGKAHADIVDSMAPKDKTGDKTP
ncbi:MAG: DDE-type integrase/transposase/recombinase [Myxococcota bacterium]|nr:DDE-type integrase/transposase/recombinase [Myxococcota bacterium]